MAKTLSPCRCIQTASCGCTIWHILLVGNCELVPSPWVSLWWFLKGYIGKFESFRCLSLPKWLKFRCLGGLLSCAPCHGKPHFSLPCSSWEQPGGAGTSSWLDCVSTLMGIVGSLLMLATRGHRISLFQWQTWWYTFGSDKLRYC